MAEKGGSEDEASTWVHEIHDRDILMGRGKKSNARPGNVLLRRLAETKASAYSVLSTKKEKRQFARDFISDIEKTGARFLQPISVSHLGSYKTAYQIVPKATVEVKIKQLLRDRAAVIVDRVAASGLDGSTRNNPLSSAAVTRSALANIPSPSRTASGDGPLASLSAAALLPSSNLGMIGSSSILEQIALYERAQQLQRLRELEQQQVAGAAHNASTSNKDPASIGDTARRPSLQGASNDIAQSPLFSLQQNLGSLSWSPALTGQRSNLEVALQLQRLHEQQMAALLLGQQQANSIEMLLAQQQQLQGLQLPSSYLGSALGGLSSLGTSADNSAPPLQDSQLASTARAAEPSSSEQATDSSSRLSSDSNQDNSF